MADDETTESSLVLSLIKVFCMIVFFVLILVVGSLPIRLKAFKSNKKLLSFTAAFSGGLFLAVGLLHLLPEAQENFESYYEEEGTDDVDHFPFSFMITIASFALILFIEKVATDHHHHTEEHDHDHSQVHDDQNKLLVNNSVDTAALLRDGTSLPIMSEEEQFKDTVNTQVNLAKKISFVQMVKKSIIKDPKNSVIFENVNTWAPYLLQIAVGIHAVFEGLSIGIQTDVGMCLGVGLAVLCHKWAEGLTLGLAFRQAGVDKKTSTIMIAIQAIMNPLGIGIGWVLSDLGPLITGIFLSISVGTFLYISTLEILVEEFSVSRYKWQKYCIFLVAILFVSSFWFIEQAVGE